jgi:hypothetical protein
MSAQGRLDNPRPLAKATASSSAKEAAAMPMVRHENDDSQVAVSALCPACGREPAAMLRQLYAERQEAWRAGVLEGFETGWTQGLGARVERGAA